MLVRTWNLFHGNTVPPRRRAYLREMVELISADGPDVVCLQEVPAWALGLVGGWARMQASSVRARGARLGPLPIPAALGHGATAIHHGLFRSAFAGQGNAILIPADATIRASKTITLNTNVFCEERGGRIGLSPKQMRDWEKERRVCQLVHYELPNRRRILVANLHATSLPQDTRLADAELRRAVNFVERGAETEETVIVAGDFNITREQSRTIEELTSAPPESRWTDSSSHVDHVLLRRGEAVSVRVWPEAERTYEGRILSDHAPVEVEVALPER